MQPVAKIATGLVLVFGAVRFNGFDLLFDPVGWALCVAGLDQLRRSDRDLPGRAMLVAVVMIFVSLFATLAVPAITEESMATQVIGLANGGGGLVAVWLITDAVIQRLRGHGDVARVARLDVLRWAVAGLGAIVMLAERGDAVLGDVVLIGWLSAVVVLVVVFYRWAGLPCLAAVRRPATESDKPVP
ncbi:hypothetical protein AB0I81_46290 [Nonomuraea sp. NPDC050404]|uniref:hypothetical protein n=1 Tax=Nonomuraea sp. NPDC050404 TaxID=3155783 RepID=UPI0033D692D2